MEHDKVMIERIKLDVAEWMNTHGQVMMGEEISADVCNIIDESVERTKRIRDVIGEEGEVQIEKSEALKLPGIF